MRGETDDDWSMFEGKNPFEHNPMARDAIAWERARFKTHWDGEIVKLRQKADETRAQLGLALSVGDPADGPEVDQIRNYTWEQLLVYAGWLKGKASVPLPPIHVTAPAGKARRAHRSR